MLKLLSSQLFLTELYEKSALYFHQSPYWPYSLCDKKNQRHLETLKYVVLSNMTNAGYRSQSQFFAYVRKPRLE